MITIPTRTDQARYTQQVDLDSVKYTLAFEWNDRAGAWFLDVRAEDETPLVSGVRVVVGWLLLNRYRDPRLPAGVIEAIDTSGKQVDPAFADLGDRVLLCYTPAAELPDSLVITP